VAEFLLGLLGNLLAAEIGEWLPRLSFCILKYSLKKLPPELSERLSEEWHAVLIDIPGGFSKVKCAIGFLWGIPRIRHEFYLPDEPFSPIAFRAIRAVDAIFSAAGLLFFIPLLLLVALIVVITSRGPVVESEIQLRNDGSPFRLFWFRTTVAFGEPLKIKYSPVGRWLELTRLNMLPLLFNVLIGDLSLYGTKPNREPIYHSSGRNDSAISQLRPGMFFFDPPHINDYLKSPFLNYFRALGNITLSILIGRPSD
jgi:hypothetical protein